MADNTLDLSKKKTEKALSRIGAKIADANDIADKIGDLSDDAEQKLCEAQEELSDLYESLDDASGRGTAKASPPKKKGT